MSSEQSTTTMTTTASTVRASESDDRSVYMTLTLIIQVSLGVGLAIFLWRRDWENVFLTAIVILITLAPALLSKRYRIFVPPEFQLIAAAFVFLSLFLGSATDFYYKYWWWDIVLHTSSGFLLGVAGFIAMFLLNRSPALPDSIRPAFVCFFAVTFAVTLGVVWEIFEFAVDRLAPGVNMQSNETGVVDTMQDLIVDTIGAVIVALMGYGYARTGRYSFIADGVGGFIRRNPGLFPRRAGGGAQAGKTRSQ